jgi:hypothetical protein
VIISLCLYSLSHNAYCFLFVYFIAMGFLVVNAWYLYTVDDLNKDADRKEWHEAKKRIYDHY